MIIEDDADIRDTLSEILESSGYRVTVAANGMEGLLRLRGLRESDRPDIILVDLMMPIMNGWEFITAKNEDSALAHTPVVLISADQHVTAIDARGAAAVLTKPFRMQSLLDIVEQHCKGAST